MKPSDYLKIRPPKTATPGEIKVLREAFKALVQEDFSESPDGKKIFTDPVTGKSFSDAPNFIQYLYSKEIGIPDKTPARYIELILQNWYENFTKIPEYESTMSAAPKYGAESNTITSRLGEMEEANERKQAEVAKINEQSNEEIQRALDQKIKIAKKAAEDLKDKNVYASSTEEKVNITKLQEEKAQILIDQINANPEKALNTIKEEIRTRVDDTIPDNAVTATAAYIVAVNIKAAPSIPLQNAVVASMGTDPKYISWASDLSNQKLTLDEIAKKIAGDAFGEGGKKLLPTLSVKVYETVQPDTVSVPLGPLPLMGQSLFKSQSEILKNPDKTSFERFDPVQQMMALSRTHGRQAGVFDEILVRETLTYFPKRATPHTWVDLGGDRTFSLAMGAPKGSGLVGKLTEELTKKAAVKLANQAVKKATGAEIGAQIGTALGIEGGPLAVVTAAIGAVIGWLADRINWKTAKKWSAAIVGGFAALIALPFGLVTSLLVGTGVTIGALALGAGLGSITLSTIGTGIGGFFGSLMGATLGAIGGPILFILLGFPVIVALILFIINSGAYVVPQSSVSGGGFGSGLGGVSCTTAQTPTGISYSVNSPIATKALQIVNNLYQGFWCYWNHSPDYPSYWNQAKFQENPNPSESSISNCSQCMFWCTALVLESYKAGNDSIQNTLWAPTMKEDFDARNKFLSNNSKFPANNSTKPTPDNVLPGSVIFFQVQGGSFPDIINHVGIVYRVDKNGAVFLQSNAGTKMGQLNYNGGVWTYAGGIMVAGFGLP